MSSRSPPPKRSRAEVHAHPARDAAAPPRVGGGGGVTPNMTPHPTPRPSPFASPGHKPERTTVTMNIHMAAAFDRSPVVTDLREIPWAKQGDIIAVRPVERREWAPQGSEGAEGNAAAAAAVGEERRVGREPGGRGVKGFFLFRLGGNDEMKLKKLQQVSPRGLCVRRGGVLIKRGIAAFVVG